MLAADVSRSDQELAARLADASGGADVDPQSYALIAKILKSDRPVTPDADLSALLTALQREEHSGGYSQPQPANQSAAGHSRPTQPASQGISFQVQVQRTASGGSGYAFDRDSLRISSRPKDAAKLRTMQVGDYIVAVNGQQVTSCAEYNNLARGVSNFELTLRRPTRPPSTPASQVPSQAIPKAQARGARSQSGAPRRRAGPQTRRDEWDAMRMNVDNMSYEQLLAWEEQQGTVKKPGLAKSALDGLPVEHICGGGDECGICLEDFCDGERAVRLPCLHKFHESCGREWLKRQARCPFCNCEVVM